VLVINTQHLCEIDGTVVVEGLAEMIRLAFDVTEMNKKDLLLRTPLPCKSGNVLTHQPEIRLTEGDAVHRTWRHAKYTAKCIGAGENATDAAERRDRWIVRM